MIIPKEWQSNTPISAEQLNQEVHDTVEDLYTRGLVLNVMNSSSIGAYGDFYTTWETMEPNPIFTITIDQKVAGTGWIFMYKMDLMVSVASGTVYLNIWDATDGVYLSTGSYGIAATQFGGVNTLLPVSGTYYHEFANVGEHELQLHGKVSSGIGYLTIANAYALFGAMESY